ncbi:MAG TPA: hypothetical protein DIU14_09620, partial [Actinobacteria bacterium]|nr:hypothetical protein [Actinomycetota bacterium]
MRTIRVAVVDEHEIFRRGVVACLQEDPMVAVVSEGPEGAASEQADVGVVSSTAAVRQVFPWPLVVCSGEPHAVPEARYFVLI